MLIECQQLKVGVQGATLLMRFSPSEPSSSPTYRHAANDAIASTALKAEKYKNCTGWRKFISYHTDRSSSVI